MFQGDLKIDHMENLNRIVMAINSGIHWQLMVVWPIENSISFLDPMRKSNQAIKSVTECWRFDITSV